MEKLAYEFRDFNIENHNITFDTDGEGVLLSFPFTENTPAIIKNKLNGMISRAINIYLMNSIIEGCIPTAENLLLNASMQINQCYGEKPQYYISLTISDLYPEIGMDVWIEETCNIYSESLEFRNEFIAYCRYQLDKMLFWQL